MHFTMRIASLILAFAASSALADQCASGSILDGGNYFCQLVDAIQYSNVGHAGSYNKVTSMGSDGKCATTPVPYSGSLAPLDEEVSLHFRGPITLKQVAAYTKTSGSPKKRDTHSHSRHGHKAFHARALKESVEKRADIVTATIDGVVQTWENNYFGPGGAKATDAPSPAAAAPAKPAKPAPEVAVPAAVVAAAKQKQKQTADPNAAYTRSGYYDAASQTLDGLTFLGNYGGSGSGIFDNVFGNSLSYLNSAGTGAAASSSVLADALIGSNKEFAIFTDKECVAGDSCGYTRPGSVAYHGFDGADKVFLLEFGMPSDATSGFNADMPAVWMLNAQIPRTLQYGEASCSCWTTGCGEFDIAEVLMSGDKRCKSTLHTNAPGGSSDYFARPTSGTVKLAVIFNGADGTANIQKLSDDATFPASLTANQVSTFLNSVTGSLLSTFSVAA
ncbi:target of Sbf [Pseudogymnoascus destructans]|uniref:glucan endo-1,3-beta-D-glucosidase n=2 Tax=Pseudogymnoascus destructans TaxID=655981 RepID=L8G239_PSED2|nr:target of Sbf [Pseudogymnoascus destructans]ELR07172.1 hypothetical protein GMDG_08299 [Pseudogymnoascus destructans 20631-21]OAF56136.1 target of Sbf [Pseudogymnoascus destructans]